MDGSKAAAEPGRGSTLVVLRALLRGKGLLVTGWLAALVLGTALTLAIPVGVRRMIDHGFSDSGAIREVFAGLAVLAASLAFVTAARLFFVTQLGDRVVGTLRKDLFSQLIRRDLRFHERVAAAELVSRLSTDAEHVRVLVGASASGLLRNLLTLSGAVVMLFVTASGLALVTVVAIPLAIAPIMLSMHRVRHLSRESLDRMAAASAVASQAFDAVRTVHDFAREDHEARRYRSAIQHAEQALARRSVTQAVFAGVAIGLIFAVVIGVLWIGAGRVATGAMTGGMLGQFVMFAVIGGMAVIDLVELWGMLQRSLGATGRIAELYDPHAPDARSPEAGPPAPRGLPVRFDGVGFAYPRRNGEPVLDGVSFQVEAGQRVAIIGASGAGKSTLFSLLLGHYGCDSGRILVGGRDIAGVPRNELRSLIAIVSQDPVVFSASVMENIRYGRLDAADAEVVAAARAADAYGFVSALPNGFDEVLGEGGTQLSGGQLQRISIARAILRDAPILLLDEATSALDADTESRVHRALEALSRQRTTLMIAHRLSTVVGADAIVVLEGGRVAAMGTHDELLTLHPAYARLARLQQLEREPGPRAAVSAESS